MGMDISLQERAFIAQQSNARLTSTKGKKRAWRTAGLIIFAFWTGVLVAHWLFV